MGRLRAEKGLGSPSTEWGRSWRAHWTLLRNWQTSIDRIEPAQSLMPRAPNFAGSGYSVLYGFEEFPLHTFMAEAAPPFVRARELL